MATNEKKDIRWIQRFALFKKALNQLTKFTEHGQLSELEDNKGTKASLHWKDGGFESGLMVSIVRISG